MYKNPADIVNNSKPRLWVPSNLVFQPSFAFSRCLFYFRWRWIKLNSGVLLGKYLLYLENQAKHVHLKTKPRNFLKETIEKRK